jgi:hypothetical protein
MARRVKPVLALIFGLGSLLGGCSLYEKAKRPAWRESAENVCIAERRVTPSASIVPVGEMSGPGICGLVHPYKVTALQGGAVTFNSTMTLDCPMIAELDGWLADVVQPAARARFGTDVAQINSMGSYACRGMNNQMGAALSEHSFGNAIDIGGFVLADGRTISIVRDWTRGDEQTQSFLRDVQAGACEHFTTVLAPGSNAFHYNHIHVDLAMHGNSSRGLRRVCKPAPQQTAPAPRRDDLPDAPDLEEDVDMAQAPARASSTYAMHASVPPGLPPEPISRPAGLARTPRLPARIREDGAYVPEGDPSDWDQTSSIHKR